MMNNTKTWLCLLLLFSSMVGWSQEQEQWRWVAPYPPRLEAYSATVVANRAYFWCAGNLFLATADGGSSFAVLPYAPSRDVALGCCNGHGLAFADSLKGYITDIAYGQFRTTNGGRTWTDEEDAYGGFEMVEFGSSTVGWKIGEAGTHRTTDAGVSWSPVGELYSTGGTFSYIYALDANRLWVMKSFHGGRPAEGSIWYSRNSGSTWTRVNTGLVSDSGSQVTYSTMHINSSGIGFAVGDIYRPAMQTREAFILKTTNAGESWSYTGLPNEQWRSLVSVSDSVWVLVGNVGSFPDTHPIQRRTTDIGGTWLLSTPFSTEQFSVLSSAVYLKESDAIVVTTLQGIYRSTDGGQSYTRLTSDRDIIVTDVALEKRPSSASQQIVIAKTTYGRSYLLSTDGGASWQRREIPAAIGSEMWGTQIVDGYIFLITDQSRLYKSTDLGDSWTQINVPSFGALRALGAYDGMHLALQGYPNIVSSADGGSSWLRGPFPETMWLHELEIVSPGTFVAVGGFYDSTGTNGIIYRTTDNGLSWRIEDTPTEMLQVSMIDENIGFAMGANRLYKTTDSGKSWYVSQSATGYYSFQAFCFKDSTNGILQDAYFTFGTSDGGVSWQQINLGFPVQYQVHRMAFNAQGELLATYNGRLVIRSARRGTTTERPTSRMAAEPTLHQNYPNPFNPSTTIRYGLPSRSRVTLTVFNTLGQQVAILVEGEMEAGYHEVQLDASRLSSGVYLYRLTAGSFVETRKLVLVR